MPVKEGEDDQQLIKKQIQTEPKQSAICQNFMRKEMQIIYYPSST